MIAGMKFKLSAQTRASSSTTSSGGNFQRMTGDNDGTYTGTALPVLADAFDNPVFLEETGEITGTVSGVAVGDEQQDKRQ